MIYCMQIILCILFYFNIFIIYPKYYTYITSLQYLVLILSGYALCSYYKPIPPVSSTTYLSPLLTPVGFFEWMVDDGHPWQQHSLVQLLITTPNHLFHQPHTYPHYSPLLDFLTGWQVQLLTTNPYHLYHQPDTYPHYSPLLDFLNGWQMMATHGSSIP